MPVNCETRYRNHCVCDIPPGYRVSFSFNPTITIKGMEETILYVLALAKPN